jgi:hypothetical protein
VQDPAATMEDPSETVRDPAATGGSNYNFGGPSRIC